MNLRALIERDLLETLEGDFAGIVSLISPEGLRQDGIKAQVNAATRRIDPDTGETVVVNRPSIAVRRSSLSRVPVAGECWGCIVATSPLTGATPNTYVIERTPEDGETIGFVRLYLSRARQAPAPPVPPEEEP